MKTLFNEADKNEILQRLNSLRETNHRKWGQMTVTQMLHHQTEALQIHVGEMEGVKVKLPFPMLMVRFMLFHMKWPKNSPTIPNIDQVKNPKQLGSFESEKNELIRIINKFHALPEDFVFPIHPITGAMTRKRWGIHSYKHVDWHLNQFSA